jgi:protein-L-isoaspartate(D-aspartate) O-methyltransferase
VALAAEQIHRRLIDQLIGRGALWSPRLIDAFRATPRHLFLDRVYHYDRKQGWQEVNTQNPGRRELRLLYSDRALTTRLSEASAEQAPRPISSSSQPSLMAQMLEDLQLSPGQGALEIGAGTGYNAALLAWMVGKVSSLDVDQRVLAEAAEHLRRFPDRQVELHHGDGRLGHPAGAPFDRNMVTAATPDLEPAWLEQLAPGGQLQAPLELAPGLAYLVQGTVCDGRFEGQLTRAAYFMPLRGEHEAGRDTASAGVSVPPSPEPLPVTGAPWADWASRRGSCGGPGLLPALLFWGWLHGLAVNVQTLANGTTLYGVADLVRGHACWLGIREWRTTGESGRRLGWQLWHSFLRAGGPWPGELDLTAWPVEKPHLAPQAPHDGPAFHRRGTRCHLLWKLHQPRRRPVDA